MWAQTKGCSNRSATCLRWRNRSWVSWIVVTDLHPSAQQELLHSLELARQAEDKAAAEWGAVQDRGHVKPPANAGDRRRLTVQRLIKAIVPARTEHAPLVFRLRRGAAGAPHESLGPTALGPQRRGDE